MIPMICLDPNEFASVTDDVEQLLLEDPAEDAGANSTEGTSDGVDNNPKNLNSMSLNQGIALMQKAFNFQGTIRPYCEQ